ncbi:hypothetical protein OG936_26310 [Streptomyces sp. NBC_00846]|uniref:hypothetical protein n=1 Tax=Streptomyces sp. NBC_00846 TaxID=2975849 RepID=UPI003866CCC9|nr:hypothetical protein OG936_26310 [Streptomyces sp. NBC_00846]
MKGKGYVDPTAADQLRYRFDRWAVESVENRTASKRYKQQRIRALDRDLDRRTRSIEHQPKPRPVAGPKGDPGPPGPEGQPGPAPAAVVVVTDHHGRATWLLDPPLPAPPVISATAVDRERGEDGPLTLTAEEVTGATVTVRVWRTRPVLGLGLLPAVPAADVDVHLTATLADRG